MRELVEAIQNALPTPGMPVTVVAVDGHGGSGKSTLAAKLAKELNAEIIHTDDFAGWDNPKNWWPNLRDTVLTPMKHGAKTLNYQPITPNPLKISPLPRL